MSRQARSFRFSAPSVLGLVLIAPLLAQCDRDEPPSAPKAPEAIKPVEIQTQPLGPPPALTRAELINGLAQSASLHASGRTIEGTDPLVGRTFSLRMPFGCTGPATTETPSDGLAHWRWGPDQESIRLSLSPADWIDAPLMQGAVVAEGTEPQPNQWEAVEGMWIARPWLASEDCPDATLSASISAPPSPQTTGIAAVFGQESSRLGRRNGRAYEFTIRQQGDTPLTAPTTGYRLRLEGRVVAFPDGRATRCVSYNPDQRPTCVAAVQMDRVAFEDAAGTVLSEWRTN